MTRGEGFDIADTDTGMLADKKVLALARRLRDATKTGAAIALYDAVRLASWKDGSRLCLDDTVPGWWLDPIDELAEALVYVGLLDEERRIPTQAWQGWFEVAWARRQRYRDLGARGGFTKAERAAQGKPPLERTQEPPLQRMPHRTPHRTVERTVYPVPSVPTEPSVARAPARETLAKASGKETTGCFRCGGPATENNPFLALPDGRVKHRFSPCPSATAEPDWLASGAQP